MNQSLSVNELSFQNARERVENRSRPLKKELGLLNASFMQILIILQITWIGQATKSGSSHILFWLIAVVFFFLPSAAVVIYLSRLMPLEGGLYQWSKLSFGESVGFLVGWNYYVSGIVFIATIGIDVAVCLSYISRQASWLADNKWIITTANCAVIGALTILAILGLRVSRIVYNAGGVLRFFLLIVLVTLPFLNLLKGSLIEYHPLKVTGVAIGTPTLLLANLSILGKIAFGAFSGFDEVPILAGECRNAGRTISYSVLIATPIIVFLYILSTSSILALVPKSEEVDLIGTLQQSFKYGFEPFGIEGVIVPVASIVLMFVLIATISVVFTENTRLPMAGGWDEMLPQWFSRLHPERSLPVNAIIFTGAVSFILALAGLIGTGYEVTFQLLLNTSFVLWALTYLVMFAIPILALKDIRPRPQSWLKIVSVIGFLTTLLYIALSIFPIIDETHWLQYGAKLAGTVLIVNAIGILIAVRTRRRKVARQKLNPHPTAN